MPGYGPYTEEELNLQYSLRNVRPDYETTMIPRWQRRSAAYRDRAGGRYDIAYGDGERDLADFFPAKSSNGGLILYIHGGYWQRGDKSVYSFVAEPYNEAGFAVIAINYMLCPKVKVGDIPPQCRRALTWAWDHAEELGASADRFYVMGHSAGAHLTAWMMATDWPGHDPRYPREMIKAAAPISGLYDFEPIRHTSENRGTGTNKGFGLNVESAEEARAVSLVEHPPATEAPQLMAWGLEESDEFVRQNEEHYARLRATSTPVSALRVPDKDHFDLVDVMGDGKSELVSRILALFSE